MERVALISAILLCGCNGGLNSHVIGVKPLSEIDRDEQSVLCDTINAYLASRMSAEATRDLSCTIDALNSTTDREACLLARQSCIAATPADAPMWSFSCADLPSCSATVNAYEACWQTDVDAYSAALAAISCDVAGMASTDALTALPPVPEVCSEAGSMCAEIRDGVFDRGGAACFECSPFADCSFGRCACRAGYEGDGVRCEPVGSATEGLLRLVGGPTRWEGRLEVYHAGEWGTVCDDSFGSPDGRVACRDLGSSGLDGITQGRNYPGTDTSSPIWMDDVGCGGSESRLVECSFAGFGNENCSHSEDVGLRCEPPVEPTCAGNTVTVTASEETVRLLPPAQARITNPGPMTIQVGVDCSSLFTCADVTLMEAGDQVTFSAERLTIALLEPDAPGEGAQDICVEFLDPEAP